MKIKSVSEIEHIEGKRIILRSDLNVPIVGGAVRDDYRILRALPTIQFLTSRGAKIVLLTHLGDDGSESLAPIAKKLEEQKVPLAFLDTTDKATIEKAVDGMQNGNVLLLTNIRAFAGEKENDIEFSKWLASLGEIFVNDAFSVSHREHASIVGLPKLMPSFAGMQLLEEVEHLSALQENPARPYVVIFGGAKLSTKMKLIKKISEKANKVIVGGALLNQILFLQGKEIGDSFHDESAGIPENDNSTKDFINLKIFDTEKFYLPEDLVVKRKPTEDSADVVKNINTDAVIKGDVIVDIGPKSIVKIKFILDGAKTVLWNGPMGKYEDGFGGATEALLNKLAGVSDATHSTIGGGDTVALASKLGLVDKFHFVSTGGGATLEYLEKSTLPGIVALEQ